MGKNTKRCMKCENEYSKKLLFCPKCGEIDDRRAYQIRDLEFKVHANPNIGIQCKQCGSIFPNDQTKCPYCGVAVGQETIKNISSVNRDDLKNIVTPICSYFSGRPVNAKSYVKMKTPTSMGQKLRPCSVCNHQISIRAESCPNCGNPTGVHVCPKCNGINTKVISGASKAVSVWAWGPFAANKVVSKYQCKDCGHKF